MFIKRSKVDVLTVIEADDHNLSSDEDTEKLISNAAKIKKALESENTKSENDAVN